MATTTGTFVWFALGKENLAAGIDLLTGMSTLQVMLITNVSEPTAATDEFVSDVVANEVADTDYARQTLTSVTWSDTASTSTLDSADPAWVATTASITARWWILFSNETGADATRELIAYGLLDNSPADVVATTGNTLTYNVPAAGWFTLT